MTKPVKPKLVADLSITKRPKRRATFCVGKRSRRLRFHLIALALLTVAQGCASQDHASRAAEQAATESEDHAACGKKGAPGTLAYEDCRKSLAEAKAQASAIQEQKRRDFDRVLGAGTDGQSN